MPTYSYRCTECDNAFDIQQLFTDDTLSVCPVCGGKLRKVFSPVGVSFNGSGFYRTDSRAKPSDSGSSTAGASTGGDSGASTGDSGGSSGDSGGSSGGDSAKKVASPTKETAKPAASSGSTSSGSTGTF